MARFQSESHSTAEQQQVLALLLRYSEQQGPKVELRFRRIHDRRLEQRQPLFAHGSVEDERLRAGGVLRDRTSERVCGVA